MVSDHLGLVLLDDEREPAFIDPLAGHYGRVRLSKHGVFLRPDGAVRPKKVFKGSWSLLDEEDLVRHIRYLNSPLGFFPYYENGQVIRADAKEYPRFEYQVQTNGEDITFRVVCDDMMSDIYTLERTLQHYVGRAIERTTEYLHADVGFARIEKPVVSLDERGQSVRLRGQPSDKRSMAIWLAVGHLRQREIIQHDKTNEAYQAMKFWNQYSQTFNAHQERMCKEMWEEEKEQGEQPKKYGYLSNTIRLHRRLRRLDVRERQQLMGVRMTSDMFAANYFKREELESARARWSEDISEVCTQYITARRAMFAKDTHEFFTSPVYETLVVQYREAHKIKRAAQGLLGT
jgi:hypothetical protein